MKLRNQVFERDKSACWHCGETEGLTLQHRQNRQMGGSKLRDRVDNLIVFCAVGNARMESDAEFAVVARKNGWKLSSWMDYSTPVWSEWEQGWFVLTPTGEKIKETDTKWILNN